MKKLNNTALIHTAVVALSQNCDGAATLDGVGFNGVDAPFGHSIAHRPLDKWTPKMARAAYQMIRKYRKQLSAHGINYDAMHDPKTQDFVVKTKAPTTNNNKTKPVQCTAVPAQDCTIDRDADFFIIKFGYNAGIVNAVKALPGRRFNGKDKYWTVPFSVENFEAIRIFAKRNEFTVNCTEEMEQWEALTSNDKEEEVVFNTPVDFKYKTTPKEHQKYIFELSRNEDVYAYLMEQGTGKTKPTIDIVAWQYMGGNINALFTVAPNGVHKNWSSRELPKHMPAHVPFIAVPYVSNPNKAEKAMMEKLMDPAYEGLRILTMSYDSVITKKGRAFAEKFLMINRVMMVLDESQKIKNPSRKIKRSNICVKLGLLAKIRRILSGTAITQAPFDLYMQYKFLDESILGFPSYTPFKHHFGVWEKKPTKNNRQGFYEEFIEYKNMDELVRLIKPHTYRVEKKDCLDIPDKEYESRIVPMSREQKKLYSELWKDSRIELEGYMDALIAGEQDSKSVAPKNALTKLLRLQQLTGGYLATEDKEVTQVSNTKLLATQEIIEDSHGKVIVWARFQNELQAIAQMCRDNNIGFVEYHGRVDQKARHANIDKFQEDPSCRVFISQQQSGGTGITLTAATTVIYYSNDFSLENRLQSEDRNHRIGQANKVTYIDLECEGTIDQRVIQVLTDKARVANDIYKELK